jgi:hypothetical protein
MFGNLPRNNRTVDQFTALAACFGFLKPFRNVTAHETI